MVSHIDLGNRSHAPYQHVSFNDCRLAFSIIWWLGALIVFKQIIQNECNILPNNIVFLFVFQIMVGNFCPSIVGPMVFIEIFIHCHNIVSVQLCRKHTEYVERLHNIKI
uniref:Uncharacterized protein n=1 Tax=Cacopsylla melanoneura TaxID=428564 RepID=A0A8D9EYJ6_9HEMI